MFLEVFFDVETKKLFEEVDGWDPAGLGVWVVSAYRRQLDENHKEVGGEMRSFWEEDFEKLWPWLEEADRVVGFNSLGFDVPALEPYYSRGLAKLKHFDILAKVKEVLGHRLSLDALARETLGHTKIAVGTQAVEWWKKGDRESLNNLRQYCEMDVQVTKEIYDHGLNHRRLMYKDRWNESREVMVDFSYPVIPVKTEEQIGLF